MKVELFVSSTCPHCPKAKLEVSRAIKKFDDVSFEKIRMNTPEGKERAAKYHIMGVPALVVDGEVMRGNIEESNVVSFIKRKLNPKKSIFSIFK